MLGDVCADPRLDAWKGCCDLIHAGYLAVRVLKHSLDDPLMGVGPNLMRTGRVDQSLQTKACEAQSAFQRLAVQRTAAPLDQMDARGARESFASASSKMVELTHHVHLDTPLASVNAVPPSDDRSDRPLELLVAQDSVTRDARCARDPAFAENAPARPRALQKVGRRVHSPLKRDARHRSVGVSLVGA